LEQAAFAAAVTSAGNLGLNARRGGVENGCMRHQRAPDFEDTP
jgi:hypothetical protein